MKPIGKWKRTLIRLIALVLIGGGLSACAWPIVGVLAAVGITGKKGGSDPLLFLPPAPVRLTEIQVSAANTSIAKGTSIQMTATAVYSNGATEDVTSGATWSSSDNVMVNVDASGLASSVTAPSTGSADITATYQEISGSSTITVTDAALTSLEVTSKSISIPTGFTYQFKATGIFSDNSTQDLTEDPGLTWSTSAAGVATVTASGSGGGTATGVSSGSAVITATHSGQSDTAALGVTSAAVVGFSVTPQNALISANTSKQFTARGIFSNNTILDLTEFSNWSSSSAAVATITNNVGLADGIAAGTTTITGAYGANTASALLTVENCILTGITVAPNNASIAYGTRQQFTATGNFSNCVSLDITGDVLWSSTDPNIASIENANDRKGRASSVAAGSVTITAALGGVSGTASLTVRNATLSSISVTPNVATLVIGESTAFSAVGTYSDGVSQDITNQVVWSSSDASLAVISNAALNTGLANALAAGTATITATRDGISATATVNISADTTPPTLTSISLDKSVFPPRILVTFSEPVGASQALTLSNWKIVETESGTCAGGNNFSSSTQTSDFAINGISAVSLTQFYLNLNGETQNKTYTVITDGSAGNANRIRDLAASPNYISCPNTANFQGVDTTPPNLVSVSLDKSVVPPRILVTFNEPVNLTQAALVANWKVVETESGTCAGGDNFSGSAQTSDFIISTVTSASSTQFYLNLSEDTLDKTYTVITDGSSANANRVRDLAASPNYISCPNSLSFLGTDTKSPAVTSAVLDTSVSPPRILVTLSEPVNSTQATLLANWKIVETVGGTCAGGDNFSGSTQTADFAITGVTSLSTSQYYLQLDTATGVKTYTVITDNSTGNANRIRDLAVTPNYIDCPNNKTFLGVDTVKPYLLTAISPTSRSIIVKFSEDVNTVQATTTSNWTVIEDPDDPCGSPSSSNPDSVTQIDGSTYQLNFSWDQCGIKYRVSTVAANIADAAGNTMGVPDFLTFTGNEPIKVVSAVSTSLTTVEVTFSKPVKADVACSNSGDCAERFIFNPPLLGNITNASIGTGSRNNVVTLTHSTDQEGYAYTVIAANNIDGDNFINTTNTFKTVRNLADTENLQAAPRDRASFIGSGNLIDTFDDGTYFDDPFVDGTTFSFAFNYGGRVYLGTNDTNSAAFRFEPSGANSVLVTFGFDNVTGTCKTAPGFGTNSAGTCGADDIGPDGEYGVAGFTSVTADFGGGNTFELLTVGTVKNGIKYVYYTQDLDTTLDWKDSLLGVTGGNNTESVQTIYAVGTKLYVTVPSNHITQSPLASFHAMSETGGVVTVEPGVSTLAVNGIQYFGKGAGNPAKANNNDAVVGVDSLLYVPSTSQTVSRDTLFMANNGALIYSDNAVDGANAYFPPDLQSQFAVALDLRSTTRGNTTLVLPYDPVGLGKISPGQKGAPFIVRYKDILYMARNIAQAETDAGQVIRAGAELWKCKTSCNSSANWTKIGTASNFTAGGSVTGTNLAISLMQVNNDALYIGFDNTSGIAVFRTDIAEIDANNSGNAEADFTLQHTQGFGGSYTTVYSSTSISDGFNTYMYMIAGTGAGSIKVFRQID